jgi:hypothetical protein
MLDSHSLEFSKLSLSLSFKKAFWKNEENFILIFISTGEIRAFENGFDDFGNNFRKLFFPQNFPNFSFMK